MFFVVFALLALLPAYGLLILPGLWLTARWYLVPALAVWQPDLSWRQSLRESTKLMTDQRAYLFRWLFAIFGGFAIAKWILPTRLPPLENPWLDFSFWLLEWSFVWGVSALAWQLYRRGLRLRLGEAGSSSQTI
jgi:hypothetical protein